MGTSRFAVVQVPTILPGKCLITGNGANAGPFVDLGVSHKGYGRIYLQARVVEEMARELNKFQEKQEDFEISRDEKVQALIRQAYLNGFADGINSVERKVNEFASNVVRDLLVSGTVPDDLPALLEFQASIEDEPEDQSGPEGSEPGSESGSKQSGFPSFQ